MPSDIPVVEKAAACKRLVCIPNAVRVTGMTSALRNRVIMHVGRFSKSHKRQHILIEAFHLLQEDFPDWTIELWGGTSKQDSYERACYEIVKKYRLEDRVKFQGTTHDVPEKLAQGSIFAFPSSEEGMPLALLEAMEIGLPAVGFQSCHAVNEIIQDGVNGILCEDGVAPFAEALRKLMENEALRKELGKNAKASVSVYATEKVWQTWEDLLQRVLQES